LVPSSDTSFAGLVLMCARTAPFGECEANRVFTEPSVETDGQGRT